MHVFRFGFRGPNSRTRSEPYFCKNTMTAMPQIGPLARRPLGTFREYLGYANTVPGLTHLWLTPFGPRSIMHVAVEMLTD
jgi:hypothetical protein